MADESGRNETEETNPRVEEDNKETEVVERDSEESEEEALVYDRSSGETSEDSGNEQDNVTVNEPAASGAVEHVQEQPEEEKPGDKESDRKEREVYSGQEEIQDGEENGDEDEEEGEEEEDGQEEKDRSEDELEWKEEEEDKEKKVITKGRGEKKDDPTFVPRDTRYFLHDDRYDDDGEVNVDEENAPVDSGRDDEAAVKSPVDTVDRWTHDLYIEEKQGPRTEQEKERDRYRYERTSSDCRDRGRRGNFNAGRQRRRDNQGWKEEEFPKLDQTSYSDGKRQSYPSQDRNWSRTRDRQYQGGNQQYGKRDQQYGNKEQQYRNRDWNRDQRYEGGNQDYDNKTKRYGNRYGNRDQHKNQRYGNRDQQYGNRDQQYGYRDQQYGNREQQYGNRGRQYQGGDKNRDQKYPTRDQSWNRDDRYESKDQWHQNRDDKDQHRNKEWKFEDDWSNDQQDQVTEGSWEDDEKISSYNFTLKTTSTTTTSTTTTTTTTSSGPPVVTNSPKKSSPRATGSTKLLFGKSQTLSSHPTRVFSLKKGRGAGSGSGSALVQGQGDLGRGRGRGRGTKPIISVAPPTTSSVPTNSEATPSSIEATPTRNAVEETAAESDTESSSQEVIDEQFEDAENDEANVESKKEMVKPKRYSSQRQKPGEGEVENKENQSSIPAVATSTGGGSKVGLLPTPNFDQSLAGAHPMISHQPTLVQQMLLAQQHAAAAAQYMGMLQQQQQQSRVMTSATDVMIEGNQSNVIPPPPPAAAGATDQRELGPFHWMTPTVAAAAAYPGHFAGLYGNLHMQQLFQPTFHQQGLAPPPQPEGEMGVAGGLFIPPMDPEQQRLMQQRLQLVGASHKQSQAIPIVDPKLTDTEP